MRISLPVGGLFCPVPTSAGLDKSIHPNSNPHTDRKSCQAGQRGEYVARRRRGRGGQMFIRPIIVGDLQRIAGLSDPVWSRYGHRGGMHCKFIGRNYIIPVIHFVVCIYILCAGQIPCLSVEPQRPTICPNTRIVLRWVVVEKRELC